MANGGEMNSETIAVDLEYFAREGYFLAHGLLDPETDLQPVKQEYSLLLDGLAAEWCRQGKVSSPYHELPFAERVCKFTSEGLDCLRYFDIVLPFNTTQDTPIHLGPAVFYLLRNSRILDVLESLIGGEIYCNPVQHIRIKPPEKAVPQSLLNGLNAAVGWHQDMGVVNPEADETTMISVWLAVLDATVENGCLQVVPGSHRGELAVH
jgi:phytanoyl-CoA hydroxylase